jgi:2-keto-4-pentenoate hydratase/2-oxohepta-3-ene-1,7-dioic acid hydratase in catechol pathway
VEHDGEPLAVISVGERLYPLADGGVTVLEVLDDWARWSGALPEIADAVSEESSSVQAIPPPEQWLAPILHPRKVIGIGANYKDHLDFAGIPYPDTPYLFLKPASTTLLGSGRSMVIPHQVQYPDWEGELAVIIGRRARGISAADALGYVAGYAAANDFSARDWLANAIPPLGSDWLLHKGWDAFTPIGPLITPAEFVPDPQCLRIRLTLDGVTKQDGNTAKMVFTVAELIAHASTIMTLEPGDVFLTGTPMGSGFALEPKERLTPGQTMIVEVEGLATLTTPTVGGPA